MCLSEATLNVCMCVYVNAAVVWVESRCSRIILRHLHFAVIQVQFDSRNYTVTEGDVVNITLKAVTPSGGYGFDFTVTLQHVGWYWYRYWYWYWNGYWILAGELLYAVVAN